MIRYCPICKQYGRSKRRRIAYVPIYSVEREQRLRKCYRYLHNGEELEPLLLNQIVHKKCYSQTVECLPLIDKNDLEQTSTIQSSSQISIPYQIKRLGDRKQRSCFVCNSYHYSLKNPMKQVLTNTLAQRLAKGYLRRFKQPYGKPLLDAYIHHECYRKIYPRRHTDETSNNLTIAEFLTTSKMTIDTETELSARSDLFRPCLQQLSKEDIELYTKRNHDTVTSDSLPRMSLSVLDESTNDQSNQKIYPVAEIRYPSIKSIQSHSLDHDYLVRETSQKRIKHFDILHDWLIDHLKSSKYPISMNDVLTKCKELSDQNSNSLVTDRTHRLRIRTYFDKYYPNQLTYFIPNKRDGTYVALNDLNYYLGHSVKNLQKQSETIENETEVVVAPRTAKDYENETCELIMNAIRKIRLYIRDSKQVNCQPSIFMQNFIGLLTSSEKQFDRIAHDYSFYRMIDENLFESNEQNPLKRSDKTIRNTSLASDLISARHDHQISQKHYLLADEIAKKSFHCTPRQVISLLNRYGHTCSYDSYKRMQTTLERTTDHLLNELLNEQETPSDSERDSMEL